MHTSIQSNSSDRRTRPRASLYLAASLYCDGCSCPVKIRNLSSTGALVETPIALSAGALVQLVRGSLIVHALVAWSEEGRCGLDFSGRIDVQQWRATLRNAEQERVDHVVSLVAAGAVPLPFKGRPPEVPTNVEGLSADLQRAADLLSVLGERLVSDSAIVAGHATELQNLDIAVQVIEAVKSILNAESDLATDGMKFIGLRKSADAALCTSAAGWA